MTMAVKPISEGWHTVTPRLFVQNATELVDFLKHAFGATGAFRSDGPSEIRIGDSVVMVGEAGLREAMPTFLYIYLDDIDLAYRRAVEAGATTIEDRATFSTATAAATVRDPFR
jgi:PhnB protein